MSNLVIGGDPAQTLSRSVKVTAVSPKTAWFTLERATQEAKSRGPLLCWAASRRVGVR